MRPQTITTLTLINDNNGAFEDQTTAGAADLNLNGVLVSSGVVFVYGTANTVRQGQLFAIEGAGTNAGVDATITGTFGGGAQVEVLDLVNAGTATSTTTNSKYKFVFWNLKWLYHLCSELFACIYVHNNVRYN